MRFSSLIISLCICSVLLVLNPLTLAAENHAAFAAKEHISAWHPTPQDQRRFFPNDNSRPQRTIPLADLAPLPMEQRGIIRRVRLFKPEKILALTFDLCELATTTTGCDMELLGYLHQEQIKATLFMGGKWMRTHKARALQLLKDPLFEIGNHAWSHGNAALLTDEGLKAQVLWTQAQYELLKDEAAQEMPHLAGQILPNAPLLFRLPYGRSSPRALALLGDLGVQVIQWDVVAELAPILTNKQAQHLARLVCARIQPGSIVLLHANLVPKGSALLLKELIPQLKAQGYQFTTVSELLTLGHAERIYDGYFSKPMDNRALDRRFGVDGTGLKRGFLTTK